MVFTTEEVQTKALNEVNIEVKQSEFVAIMGPSGCGKSTLLNILGTPDRRADSLRECGTAVGLSWLPEVRTQAEGDGSPRPDEYRPSCRTFSAAAIRRTTATCGDSARRGDGLSADPCRRTDGKPGFDKRGGGDGITSRTERAGDDDRHGHALGTGCQLRTPDYPSFGRPGRFLNIHL